MSRIVMRRPRNLSRCCAMIGCGRQEPLTNRCFWSDARYAATAPRRAHTRRFNPTRKTAPQLFSPIARRAGCVMICRALEAVRRTPCCRSPRSATSEWGRRLSPLACAPPIKGAMRAFRNVPSVRSRWISPRYVSSSRLNDASDVVYANIRAKVSMIVWRLSCDRRGTWRIAPRDEDRSTGLFCR